jgi:hypothetical protein
MAQLLRGFWIHETETGQQVAQLHDRQMMMMTSLLIILSAFYAFLLYIPASRFVQYKGVGISKHHRTVF